MTRVTVRAGYSQDAGSEGWTYGFPLAKQDKRTGATRLWLAVPGSSYDAYLHCTADVAAAELSRRWPNLSKVYEVHRVRSVWRYGRNWFEILDNADQPRGDVR